MKLKYYLRGLGIGIVITTIILTICNSFNGKEISDAEIIERARALGMVMEGEAGSSVLDVLEEESEGTSESEGASESPQDTQAAQQPDDAQEGSTSPDTPSADNVPTGTPEGQPETYTLVINAGAVCRQLCDELQANGVITDSESLRKYLGDNGYAKEIHPGSYEIPYGSSNEEIAAILSTVQDE